MSGRLKFLLISVFVLVVVGVATLIRSFASQIAFWSAGYCDLPSTVRGSCYTTLDTTTPGKSKTTVFELHDSWPTDYNYAGVQATYNSSQFVPPNHWTRACVNMKPVSNSVPVLNLNLRGGKKSWSIPPLANYSNYCTDWIQNTTGTNVYPTATLSITGKGETVRVNGITVNGSDTPPSSVAPGK